MHPTLESALNFIINNKLITFLAILSFSMTISTISLAVQKGNLSSDLNDCLAREQAISTPATTTTNGEPTTTEITTTPDLATTTTSSETADETNYRLPGCPDNCAIVPTLYDILLHPDLTKQEFSGTVTISITVRQPTNNIVLHSKDLRMTSIDFLDHPSIRYVDHSFDLELEQLIIVLSGTVTPGNYRLEISFTGEAMDKRIVGLYSSFYLDGNNDNRYIATSKFEPTFARQAFPCFDEPDMKAEFKVALVSPLGDGYSALSNTNEISRVDDANAGTMTTTFAVSRPMSTYLAVFIVSDFVGKTEVVRTNGVGTNFMLTVYSTPHQIDKLDFALETGVKVTEFYLDYFRIAYPMPKLDMAAIPDFVSGAMETWGLITYRETNLFYDPTVSSTINMQRVANVIAHEIAHMWFGNLVTMKWWNDLWLNEGFASYIEYKGIDAIYTGWNMLDQFLIDDLHGVMNLDATLGSHPIVQKVENPDQITAIFDTITYSKGASVIRMMEDFVGAENFRLGVQNYLRKHSFQNAVTDDLLTELNLLNLGYDVDQVMSTWTKQKGLPVINVERIGQASYRLTQKRFLADPDNEGKENDSDYNYRWYIPITYISSADNVTVHREWFKNDDNWVEITVDPTSEWIKINNDQIGYYRVKYEYDMWYKLSEALDKNIESMSTLNRAHLLNDAFSLAEAQQIQYDIPLTMTGYLKQEREYVPWAVAASKLRSISTLMQSNPAQAKLKTYVQGLLGEVYTFVGWALEDSSHSKNLLRISVLDLACSMGMESCLTESKTQFEAWLQNPSTRPIPDLRTNVYNYGMATATVAEWNQVQLLFLAEQDAQEKVKLMTALSKTTDRALLTQYLQSGENRQTIRDQDYFTFIQSIAANPVGESLVWDYVKQNWPALVQRFGLNERNLGRMIPSITGRFSTEAQLQDLKDFFAQYPDAGAGATARVQAIETIENNIKWLATNQKAVSDFLDTVVV